MFKAIAEYKFLAHGLAMMALALGMPVLVAGCSGSSSNAGSGTDKPASGSVSQPQPSQEVPGPPAPGPESLTRMVIGPGGGMLEAFGGAVVITIPEGALTEDVDISVQPVSATLAGTVGWAYEFKPDGLIFAKPALLTLNLANVEGSEPNADALALAYQDSAGHWRKAGTVPVAQQGDTFTFEQAHFSKWAFYEQWYLLPESAEVKTGESRSLTAMYVECVDESTDPDCLLAHLVGNAQVSQWAVNGVVNGDASVGTIGGGSNVADVLYNAPASVPAANPVSVTATVDLQAKGQLQLVSELTVIADANWAGYLEYEFHGSSTEDSDFGHSETTVSYKSHQDFSGILSESTDDDGHSFLMLELGAPVQTYDYQNVADDYYTGEDVEGCVRHRRITTQISKGGELPYSYYGTVQFNVADGYANTPMVMSPPLMIQGSRATSIEGCGSSEFSEEDIPEDMLTLDNVDREMLSTLSEDRRRYTADVEYQATMSGVQGTMKVRWTLIHN